MNLTAQNIRNIRSKDRTYPSDVHLDAVVFQNGRVALDGHADFLAVPIPGVQGDVKLDAIPPRKTLGCSTAGEPRTLGATPVVPTTRPVVEPDNRSS